jgi:hypothetical protein
MKREELLKAKQILASLNYEHILSLMHSDGPHDRKYGLLYRHVDRITNTYSDVPEFWLNKDTYQYLPK